MVHWWTIYTGILGLSAALALVLTYVWRGLALKIGLTDQPAAQAHKLHARATPVAGGIAMLGSWLGTLTLGFLGVNMLKPWLSADILEQLGSIRGVLPRLGVIALGAVFLSLVGLADDRTPMAARTKFAAQFAVAALVALYGIRIKLFITDPFITWSLTVIWVLFIVNAVNFFDNMDGLAGGVGAIAALTFLVVAGLRGQFYVAALSASVCGACLGFLVFNWPPATIFMGDCGSHFLGLMLAVLGAMTTFYVPVETPTYAPLAIPLMVLALPIFDTFAVVLIRLKLRQPIYVGDHRHISHRFMHLGLSRRCSVILVHLLALALGAGAITLIWLPPLGAVAVFAQTAFILAMVSVLHVKGKTQEYQKG